jgi:hypothetical protein
VTPYAISEYLPLDAREAAAAAKYVAHRTLDGWCPMGIALCAMGFDAPQAPDSRVFARLLEASDDWTSLRRAASQFMVDWDGDRILPSDLPAALGVTPSPAAAQPSPDTG